MKAVAAMLLAVVVSADNTSSGRGVPPPAFAVRKWRSTSRSNNFLRNPSWATGAPRTPTFRDRSGGGALAGATSWPRVQRCPAHMVPTVCAAGANSRADEDISEGPEWPLGAPAVIRFDGVAKSFEQRRWFSPPREVVALEETTLTLHGPGPFALVGDSGSGKSTFLRLTCGDVRPSAGRVLIGSPGSPNVSEVPKTGASGPAHPGSGWSATSSGRTLDEDVDPVHATQPWGVEYIDRYSAEAMVGAPSQTAAQAVAAAFDNRGSGRNRQPTQKQEFDGHENATEVLLRATGLGGVRGKRRDDLSRSQLLCLVLCVGAARALVGRMGYDNRAAPLNFLPTWPTKRVEVHDRGLLLTGGKSDTDTGTSPGPVLCLDEFLETEDIRVRRSVELACDALCAVGVTIVFATHVMSHVEGMLTAPLKAPGLPLPAVGGGEGGRSECRERVVTFTKGRAGELRCVDECTYIRWKRGEEQKRRDRTII